MLLDWQIVKYFDPKPSVELDFDSLFAICAYTYNYTNADGDAEEDSKGNLYWQMNNQLRKRGEERKAALELWGKYVRAIRAHTSPLVSFLCFLLVLPLLT